MGSDNRPPRLSAKQQAQKDVLFERAKHGKITGDEADAEAIRLGLGSLSRKPGPDEFRPEALTRWTLPMTIAWIAYLDLEEVREWSAPYREECFHWIWQRWRVGLDGLVHEGWHLEQRSKPTLTLLGISSTYDVVEGGKQLAMSIGEAQEALWMALREGFFSASGIDNETGRRVEIPPLDWHELVPVQGHGGVDEVRRGLLGTGYREVLFPTVAVRGFWRRQPERQYSIPPIMPPEGEGYMPLFCAAQWIATKGGAVQFDPVDEEIWRPAFNELLDAIASEKVRVVGTRDGQREIVPGHHFAGCAVDYPYKDAELETILSEDLYLRSYPYIDDQHWRNGFDDALMNRWKVCWTRLLAEKGDVRARWPFETIRVLKTGAPGRPTSMHMVTQELDRRGNEGPIEESVAKQAAVLSDWLKQHHPDTPQLTAKTISNKIGSQFRALRAARN